MTNTLDRLSAIVEASVAAGKAPRDIAIGVLLALKGPHPGYWVPAYDADAAARSGMEADRATYQRGGAMAAQFACNAGEAAIAAMVDSILAGK